MSGFNVEDQPAYRFEANGRRPQTDEDAAMSQPDYVARHVDEAGARAALAGRLRLTATYRFIQASHDDLLYLAAAQEVEAGANMVRMYGRVYRIVDMDKCERAREGRLWSHGDCLVCTPVEYTYYRREGDGPLKQQMITKVKG
jgi:hypothetical protein